MPPAAPRKPDPVDSAIGRRLRLLRHQRDTSLQAVADAAGVSVGYLSQIERGVSSASVRDLMRICDVLESNFAMLVADAPAAAEPPGTVVRAADRQELRFGHDVLKQVLTPRADGPIRMYMVVLEPNGSSSPDTYTHEGEEAGLVVQGRLLLTIDGVDHLLNEGDSFAMPSVLPHRFANPTASVTRVVWVNTGPAARHGR